MADKRDEKRQPLKVYEKNCNDCEKFIRDDEHMASKEEFKAWLKESFKEEFGDYKNNSKRLDRHSLILTIHTISDIAQTIAILYLIFNKS